MNLPSVLDSVSKLKREGVEKWWNRLLLLEEKGTAGPDSPQFRFDTLDGGCDSATPEKEKSAEFELTGWAGRQGMPVMLLSDHGFSPSLESMVPGRISTRRDTDC